MDNRKDNSIYERLSALLDNDSLVEIDKGAVITASGMIDGRTVFVFAHDSSISGGAVTADMADSICRVMDMAISKGAPLICLNSSAGAHIHGGLAALEGLGAIFSRHMLASERIPQISGPDRLYRHGQGQFIHVCHRPCSSKESHRRMREP